MGAIHLGTSGYVYKHWKDIFYPPKLPASRWLPLHPPPEMKRPSGTQASGTA